MSVVAVAATQHAIEALAWCFIGGGEEEEEERKYMTTHIGVCIITILIPDAARWGGGGGAFIPISCGMSSVVAMTGRCNIV